MVWFPTWSKEFFLLQSVKTGWEAHLASYSMAAGTHPRNRAARAWRITTDVHPVLRLRLEWHCTSTPPYALMACTRTTIPLPLPNKQGTAHLVKLTAVQLVNKLPTSYKTWRITTVFTRASHWFESWAISTNHNTAWMYTVSLSMSRQSDDASTLIRSTWNMLQIELCYCCWIIKW
jgi:hypothetical protein